YHISSSSYSGLPLPHPRSFPTRRSSDLGHPDAGGEVLLWRDPGVFERGISVFRCLLRGFRGCSGFRRGGEFNSFRYHGLGLGCCRCISFRTIVIPVLEVVLVDDWLAKFASILSFTRL